MRDLLRTFLQRKLFIRLKDCIIFVRLLAPQAKRKTGEEMGGKDGVVSFVCLCFRSVKQCQPLLRQCECGRAQRMFVCAL